MTEQGISAMVRTNSILFRTVSGFRSLIGKRPIVATRRICDTLNQPAKDRFGRSFEGLIEKLFLGTFRSI